MPTQRKWLILIGFDWSPRPGVVIAYRRGQIAKGLTRACIKRAGNRVKYLG